MKDITAIVYTSYAGHTRRYAALLSEKTGLPAYDPDTAKRTLPHGTPVLYMGWLMAGHVKGYRQADRYFRIRALCGVGMAETGSQEADVRKANAVPDELPVFTLQGGFELEKLSGIYHMMMSVMKNTGAKQLAEKPDRTPEENRMLQLMTIGGDLVCEDALTELIKWYETT